MQCISDTSRKRGVHPTRASGSWARKTLAAMLHPRAPAPALRALAPFVLLGAVGAGAIPAFARGNAPIRPSRAELARPAHDALPGIHEDRSAAGGTDGNGPSGRMLASLDPVPAADRGDTATGMSGQLRIHLLAPASAPAGVYPVAGGVAGRSFAFIGVLPFAVKRGAWVGAYLVGMWPAELHSVRSGAYENPEGFIEVTPENASLPVSTHFVLGDFVTHDGGPFPKYVVLREALLDKLELVLADLGIRGIPTQHVAVLSGFRTPAHNLALGDGSGRARESRHQYGDASDIIIDADHDGRMDDLNGDGRVDAADVRVIEAAVDRVERAHPELAGGLGLYEAIGPSGPFAHIDVRGTRARWGTLGRGARRITGQLVSNTAMPFPSAAKGRCYAEGSSAVLCQAFRHAP